jgi:mannitol/fructose-specific phosphotransferase system IIA component (Ntr-type)
MKLADLILEDGAVLNFSADDKWEAIEKLVDHLIAKKRVKAADRKIYLDALVRRENIASTGMDHGVALPHAQVDGLEEAVAAIGLSPKGIPFQSSDGRPARITVLLLIPKKAVQKHIRTLAGIARLLNYEEMREALLHAKSEREVLEIIRDEEAKEFA